MIKFKDVTSICKAEKRLVLAEDDGVQCIGDGAALYYMYNLPKLEIGDIFTLMDVDAEKQKKWYTHEGRIVEITGGKIPMQKAPLILFWNGMSLCPFYNEDHEMVTLLDDKYTYPIRTETDIYYDLAINPNGTC